MKRDDLVWSDRKRNWLGLPWTFTVYGLTEDRLFIKTGVLNIHEDEVRLYRILDLSLRKTLWQRIMGLGTIHVDSSDKTMKAFDISNIRNCEDVKEQLSRLVEQGELALVGRHYELPEGKREVTFKRCMNSTLLHKNGPILRLYYVPGETIYIVGRAC